MKSKRYYPIICLICLALAAAGLFSADISRKEIAKSEAARREELDKLIDEKNREIGYSLSVMCWSEKKESYLESREKVRRACAEMRGALKAVSPDDLLYRRCFESLESFADSLPEEPTPETREKCAELRKLNREIIKAKNRGAGKAEIEDALLVLIEKAGKAPYSDRIRDKSSEALCAIVSAPTEIRSA